MQRPLQRAGHRHAAELLVEADLVPAAVDDGADRLLERLGQRDGVRLGVEHRRIAVAVGERIGDRALGQPADLAEHLARGVDVEVGELAFAERLVDAEHLEQVEFLVTDVALVVAHVFLLDENATMRLGTWAKLPTSNSAQLYRSVTSVQSDVEQISAIE